MLARQPVAAGPGGPPWRVDRGATGSGQPIDPGLWFEIPATDLGRAQAAHEHLLGVELARNTMGEVDMAWFPMSEDGYGSAGTLIRGEW